VTVRKVWDGKAELEEIEADGPRGHWEGLTLFLYNPSAHQWSQSFANSKAGTLSSNIGEFKDGRVVLIGQDTVNDKTILVRAVWSDIKPGSHQYEESYSNDGGTTWVRSFIANLTRLKPSGAARTGCRTQVCVGADFRCIRKAARTARDGSTTTAPILCTISAPETNAPNRYATTTELWILTSFSPNTPPFAIESTTVLTRLVSVVVKTMVVGPIVWPATACNPIATASNRICKCSDGEWVTLGMANA
jgi:hypothetical protein